MLRRLLFVAPLIGAAILTACIFLFKSPSTSAQQNPAEPNQAQVTQLPIGQVVLFSSGVGYFQREGHIDGNARVDLSFPVSDINDLIKSMVLRDMDGGHISAVSYDSNAPIEKTLKSFAINLTANPTFGQILNQAAAKRSRLSCSRPTPPSPAP